MRLKAVATPLKKGRAVGEIIEVTKLPVSEVEAL